MTQPPYPSIPFPTLLPGGTTIELRKEARTECYERERSNGGVELIWSGQGRLHHGCDKAEEGIWTGWWAAAILLWSHTSLDHLKHNGVSRPAYVFWPVEDNRKKFRITLTNWVKILDLVAFASIKLLFRATWC